MEYRKFDQAYVVRLDRGDEVLECLSYLCRQEAIELASVTGLGAVNEVLLGLFDTEQKRYYSKDYKGVYEIASLVGNISRKDGEPYLHLHMVIGNVVTGECSGGHLSRAVISATGEIIVNVINGTVGRRMDEAVGLNLYQFGD